MPMKSFFQHCLFIADGDKTLYLSNALKPPILCLLNQAFHRNGYPLRIKDEAPSNEIGLGRPPLSGYISI